MKSTDQYNEIILIEDEELVGLRFWVPDGGSRGLRSVYSSTSMTVWTKTL